MSGHPHVVISQSMLFPWVGMLEQIRLADVFVHYDDVQFSKGSFVNRVQIKLPNGVRWMTVPLKDFHLGQRIDELQSRDTVNWRRQHLDLLKSSFEGAPFRDDAIGIVETVYGVRHDSVSDLCRSSMMALSDYFGLTAGRSFIDVCDLGIPGKSTERVLEIVKRLRGRTYITGHGAASYLEHNQFESAGISVEYIKYSHYHYPQFHGPFTPYVSALNLVAHCGPAGRDVIASQTIPWRQFLDERE